MQSYPTSSSKSSRSSSPATTSRPGTYKRTSYTESKPFAKSPPLSASVLSSKVPMPPYTPPMSPPMTPYDTYQMTPPIRQNSRIILIPQLPHRSLVLVSKMLKIAQILP